MAKSPLDDQFDREVFYRGPDPEADDVEDYELLPPDEEVVAGERQRAAEQVASAEQAVDVDELYRDQESLGIENLEDYLKDFRLRFTTKHLLIAMTVLALAFTIGRFLIQGWGAILLVLTFLTLASIYAFFSWQEYQRRQEWERKREELYRRNQDRHRKKSEAPANNRDSASSLPLRFDSIPPFDQQRSTLAFAMPRFTFSIQDLLMLAMALSLVLVAAINFGIPGASLVTGALLGVAIVLQTFLLHPPRLLASTAWILLAFYLGLSFLSLWVR